MAELCVIDYIYDTIPVNTLQSDYVYKCSDKKEICGNDNAVIKWWCTVHFYTWYFHCHISSLTYNTLPCFIAPHSYNNADAALNNIYLTHILSIFIWIFRIDGCKDDCSSHGTCLDSSQICDCNSGWTGMACETALCPNNCSGNGSCINGKCLCNEQHRGRFIAFYFYCLSKCLSKIRLEYHYYITQIFCFCQTFKLIKLILLTKIRTRYRPSWVNKLISRSLGNIIEKSQRKHSKEARVFVQSI